MNYLIFTVTGGAGKNVLATAVVNAIKNYYGNDYKIIVLTAYKDIWLYNPNVHRVFLHGHTSYFYNDYIKDRDVRIVATEPYLTEDYILKKKHLIEIWCDLAGVKYNNEQPELFFNQREVEYAQRRFLDGRKIMLIQTNGGMQQDVKISWMRDMPLDTAQEVVNKFKNDYRIIHIRRDDQPQLNGIESFSAGNFRELMSLIRFSEKRLFIDSVCQHIAAALKKESTVLWVRNNPEILGYAIHDNIATKVEDEIDTLSSSVLEPYNITGNIYECPFREGTKLFDSDEIVESIIRQKNVKVDISPIYTNGNGNSNGLKKINYPTHLSEDTEFIEFIQKEKSNVDEIVETGTFDGMGSTLVFARTNKPVFSIECNGLNYSQAVKNLSAYPNVNLIHGHSLVVSEMIEFIENDTIYSESLNIQVDDENNPKEFYKREIDISSAHENVLIPLINNTKKQLILLDSAGGIGYLEFQKVMELDKEILKHKILLLDDISHVKHYRSVKELGNSFNFSKSRRWGWYRFDDNPNENIIVKESLEEKVS